MSYSPLRWVGGKSWAADRFGPAILNHLEHTGGAYREPFLGGGSMAFFIGVRYPKLAHLSDIVEPLIDFYQELRDYPADLAQNTQQVGSEYGLDEKAYYAVRAERPDTQAYRAAQFLYLNTLGFNGVYRENAAGEYNVPAGSCTKNGTARLPEKRALEIASKSLELAEIRCEDFEAAIDRAEARDFLYVDPPYYDTFANYSKGGFGVPEHERLALALYRAAERGITFLAHNSMSGDENSGVNFWYSEFAQVIPVDEARAVSANGDRAKAKCAIVTNDATLAEKLRSL